MKGVYCLLIRLAGDIDLDVGALGARAFKGGVYVYVGSALGGIEQRVRRHRSGTKRRHWHIDYLLDRAEVVSTVSVPCRDKSMECAVANALSSLEGASTPVKGFGSSDCGCPSHLVYFGDQELDWVAETISMRLAMLECIYPRNA